MDGKDQMKTRHEDRGFTITIEKEQERENNREKRETKRENVSEREDAT